MLRHSSTFPRRPSGSARAVAAAIILFLLSPSAIAQSADDEVLLFAVRLDYLDLTDAMPAYQRGDRYLLPLGELARLLSVAIETDPGAGKASGFVIRESRSFELDVKTSTVRLEGREVDVRDRLIEVRDDDIYVETGALSEWIPIDFRVEPFNSRIVVTAREALPIHLRRDRESRLRSLLGREDEKDDGTPVVRVPYELADGPFVDQRLSFISTRARRGEVQYTTFATGDLLYAQADLFLSGTSSNPGAETRFTLSRKDPFAALLGPLHAREVAAGDVFLPGDELLLSPSSGNGVSVSSYPLVRQTQFGGHSFRGNLPPGWDVELYQNGALIRYQQSRADGLYEFSDVPLVFGPNIFRVVFYGPLGERREEVYRFNIGESLAPEGKAYYRVAANQDRTEDRRAYADIEYGLRKNLSLSAAIASARAAGIDDQFGRAGLSGYWSRLFAHADVARSSEGGTAVRAFAQSRIGSIDVYLQHAVLRDFQSDVFRNVFGRVTSDSRLRLDGFVQPAERVAFPLNLELHQQRLAGGAKIYQLQQRISAQIASTFLSNQIFGVAIVDHPTLEGTSLRGSLIGSRLLRLIALRGEIGYAIEPDTELENITILGETFQFPGYVLQLGVKRAFASRDTGVMFAANRNEGRFAAGVSVGYSRLEGATVSVNLFAGIARDSRTERWTTSARPLAASGAASARVFIDRNANGLWDSGEHPVAGAGFFVDRVSYRDLTDKQGTALITGISPFDVHRVAISPATLEDPLLVPATASYRFIPRPGKPHAIDFPVLITGEVAGTAYYRDESGGTRPAPGLRLELLLGEEVVSETRSAYDGFYQFTTIRPGTYRIRPNPEQAARVGIVAAPRRDVTIDASGSVLDGVDLVFNRGTAQPSPTAETRHNVRGRLAACDELANQRPLAGVTLFLFGPAGSAETKTEPDGSFAFPAVPTGTYLVVIARETLPANVTPNALPRVKIVVGANVSATDVTIGCPSGT